MWGGRWTDRRVLALDMEVEVVTIRTRELFVRRDEWIALLQQAR